MQSEQEVSVEITIYGHPYDVPDFDMSVIRKAIISMTEQETLKFEHTKTSNATFGSILSHSSSKDFVDEGLTEYISWRPRFMNCDLGESWLSIKNVIDVKNRILLSPNIKGKLIDIKSGTFWKFRCVKLQITDDLFWKKFSRSKVKTEFQADLFDHLRDLYLTCDDPDIDPVRGMRDELWRLMFPFYRIVKKQPIHISHFPDPTIGTPLPPYTVEQSIRALYRT